MRIGIGYDVHKLTRNRKLILGGVEIPNDLGLAGHSDADVLVHAVMDGILGALAKGDIGRHFPDSDQTYQGISSLLLLEKVYLLLVQEGYVINNLDATIVAERPKLSPYLNLIIENLSKILKTRNDQINVKATTSEGLGFTGKGEGIAAYAVVTLKRVITKES